MSTVTAVFIQSIKHNSLIQYMKPIDSICATKMLNSPRKEGTPNHIIQEDSKGRANQHINDESEYFGQVPHVINGDITQSSNSRSKKL